MKQKIGQTMIWTFSGQTLNASTEQILRIYQPGGLIAFSRNIKSLSQIAEFNAAAQTLAQKQLAAPLLLMIDQEGGTVTRVKVGTPLPSALALARMADAKFVESYAKTNGQLLARLGFNMNLSPVMDISNPKTNSFIANRVFGDDPESVSEMANAFARGLAQADVIPTAKHFPGHGGMVNDSHTAQAKKLSTLEELESGDLIPFMAFAKAEFPKAVMMAHMSLPNVDPTGVPATYSKMLIEDLLRTKYGYDGLVITDDLEMGGASISEDIGERAVRAFLAGNDMVMLAGTLKNQKRAFAAMLAAAESGRIPLARLDASVERILKIKKQNKKSPMFEEQNTLDIKTKLEALSREIMKKNFTDALGVKTDLQVWPEISTDTKVVVFASDRRFFAHFKKHFLGQSDFVRLSPETLNDVPAELARDTNTLVVFYASGAKSARWLATLSSEQRSKLIVINCNNPGKIEDQNHFLGLLHINSHSPESGGWLATALNAPTRELRTLASPTLKKRVRRPKKS